MMSCKERAFHQSKSLAAIDFGHVAGRTGDDVSCHANNGHLHARQRGALCRCVLNSQMRAKPKIRFEPKYPSTCEQLVCGSRCLVCGGSGVLVLCLGRFLSVGSCGRELGGGERGRKQPASCWGMGALQCGGFSGTRGLRYPAA